MTSSVDKVLTLFRIPESCQDPVLKVPIRVPSLRRRVPRLLEEQAELCRSVYQISRPFALRVREVSAPKTYPSPWYSEQRVTRCPR